MNLFNYLMAKKGHNTSVRDSLFSYLLGKNSIKIKEASGTTINITDATKTKFNSLSLEKESTQYTTTGANLQKFSARTSSGTYNYVCSNNGQVTITGTVSSSVGLSYNLASNSMSLTTGTYKMKVIGNATGVTFTANNANAIIGDLDSNQEAIVAVTQDVTNFQIFQYLSTGITYNCDYYITLASGGVATEERYTGGLPSPSPTYPQEINTIKDNVIITISDGENSINDTIPLGVNELAGINGVLDRLIIDDKGDCFLLKKIGKISSYNGESITTSYLSTTGGLDIGSTVYYVLDTPDVIDLEYNSNLELYIGNNTITNDKDAYMEIEYY